MVGSRCKTPRLQAQDHHNELPDLCKRENTILVLPALSNPADHDHFNSLCITFPAIALLHYCTIALLELTTLLSLLLLLLGIVIGR